jgi:hypothetical protein
MTTVNVLVHTKENECQVAKLDVNQLNELYNHFSTEHKAVAYVVTLGGKLGLVEKETFIPLPNTTQEDLDYFNNLDSLGTKNFKLSKITLKDGGFFYVLLTHSGGTRVIDVPENVLNFYKEKLSKVTQ